MCRLVAYVGEPITLAPLVFGGTHPLHEQSFRPREMLSGSVNADGYGVVWYRPDGRPARIAETRPIWHDPGLEPLLAGTTSTTAAAFLRNATPGLPVHLSAVPPLLFGRWSFGLNGYIADFRKSAMRPMHARLPDDLHAELQGVSDTEALFLLAVERLRDGAEPLEALSEVIEAALGLARKAGVECQLNILLSDGEEIVLSRAGSSEATNSLYLAHGGELARRGTLAASERLDEGPEWASVPGQSLVRLERGAEPRIIPL